MAPAMTGHISSPETERLNESYVPGMLFKRHKSQKKAVESRDFMGFSSIHRATVTFCR
jgi:hypothetical protein